ncbi:ribokinase [Patescibacteria group bacterium]|nr:MAG: ribokinase [Patescibacteria group bacterium]
MNSRICVLGSINMDMIIRVDKFPQTGETITGLSCELMPGGKGANQAIAVANMGVPVDLIGLLGNDEFGRILRDHLIAANVNINDVAQSKSSSGMAVVTVDGEGSNQIVVIPGSNALLRREIVDGYLTRQGSTVRYIISQFEVSPDLINYAFNKAKSLGAITVLNPSPLQPIPRELIEQTDMFIFNKSELAQVVALTNSIPSPNDALHMALRWRQEIGKKTVVVTLGENGLLAIHKDRIIKQPAQNIAHVIDTTGAGDCFCGSLVAFLHRGYPFDESLAFAQKAAAYSIQRRGASPSFPKFRTLVTNKMKGEMK